MFSSGDDYGLPIFRKGSMQSINRDSCASGAPHTLVFHMSTLIPRRPMASLVPHDFDNIEEAEAEAIAAVLGGHTFDGTGQTVEYTRVGGECTGDAPYLSKKPH